MNRELPDVQAGFRKGRGYNQVPLSMGFPRQEYWSGLPFPSLGDLLSPGIEFPSLALAGRFFFFLPLSHQGSPST